MVAGTCVKKEKSQDDVLSPIIGIDIVHSKGLACLAPPSLMVAENIALNRASTTLKYSARTPKESRVRSQTAVLPMGCWRCYLKPMLGTTNSTRCELASRISFT